MSMKCTLDTEVSDGISLRTESRITIDEKQKSHSFKYMSFQDRSIRPDQELSNNKDADDNKDSNSNNNNTLKTMIILTSFNTTGMNIKETKAIMLSLRV